MAVGRVNELCRVLPDGSLWLRRSRIWL
jgi:hypothetical protein